MRILIADDHAICREGIRHLLKGLDADVAVVEAADYSEAADLVRDGDGLDLILLDYYMPSRGSVGGLSGLREMARDVPLVVVTADQSGRAVREAWRAGAAGVMSKTMPTGAFDSALRIVLSGERYFPPDVLLDAARPAYETGGVLGALTGREREVLAELMKGLTNKEIARNLGIQEVTVKLHMKGIFHKLGAANRAQAVRIALDAGWEE